MNIPQTNSERKIHTPLLFNFAAYQDKTDKVKFEKDEKRINDLKLGDCVKLMTIKREYFWVIITVSIDCEIFTGEINNILFHNPEMKLGDFIKFHRDNIAGIMTKTEIEYQAKQAAEGFKKFLEQFNE